MRSSRGRGLGRPGERVPRREDAPPAPEVRVDHRLTLESEPFAKWVGDWWWFRIFVLLILRRKRRARGEWVAPFPWRMILLGWAIVIAMALVVAMAALMFAVMRARPYGL